MGLTYFHDNDLFHGMGAAVPFLAPKDSLNHNLLKIKNALICNPLLQLKTHNSDGQDCKARKTLGVIMSVFIFCWFPFFLFAILKSCFGVQIPYWLDTFTLWLGYSNRWVTALSL